MIPEYQGRIAFRLPKEDREKLEQLIREGKFRNISQEIREAITLFLSKEGQALEQFLTKQSEVSA
jgi:Arc/MetJ-type ribon-helix-helix transcriptional regulator